MPKEKKSFKLYFDQYEPTRNLPDECKARLWDAVFLYNMGKEIKFDNPVLEALFGFFQQQFQWNDKEYEKICERNDKNGQKGGRPKKTDENPEKPKITQNNPDEPKQNPSKPKKPDNDNDNDNDNEKEEEINIPSNSEFAGFVNSFQSAVTERYGNTAPTVTDGLIKKSIETLEKAKRLDGFDGEEIQLALWWAYDNQFWGPNIKSLAQIRKKGADDTSKLQKIIEQYRKRNNTANLETKKPFWETMGNVL